MRFKSSKINEFRLWGLLLTLAGMGLMILGTAGILLFGMQIGKIIAYIFMLLGLISIMLSMGVYFWAGMMSTNSTVLVCPECNRHTKMLGKTDRCMYCKTILTLDPAYAPKEETSSPS